MIKRKRKIQKDDEFTQEELKAVYLFQNYRDLIKDSENMHKDTPEYTAIMQVIKKAEDAVVALEKDMNIFIPDRKNGKKQDTQRDFYVDVLNLAFMDPHKYSSMEIIQKLKEKYGLELNPSSLSKMKSKALKAVSLCLK